MNTNISAHADDMVEAGTRTNQQSGNQKKKTVFIDGQAGTTGLRIHQRLWGRNDLDLLVLPQDKRKDDAARKEALNSCDVAFLCLPDDAARQAVSMIESPHVIVLDASTAHLTNPTFAYGFPELSNKHRDAIATGHRIAVPGCHASGFIALIRPLILAGVLQPDLPLTCHSITGYSGGGKRMIGEYQDTNRTDIYCAPRQYGLGQTHKHLPEMMAQTTLTCQPAFSPVVADYYAGMEVTVPIFAKAWHIGQAQKRIREIYAAQYHDPIVFYRENADENGFLSANVYAGKDCMEISVHGNDDIVVLCARYDNLGKGASGAAIECMNIALGLDASTGLQLEVPDHFA